MTELSTRLAPTEGAGPEAALVRVEDFSLSYRVGRRLVPAVRSANLVVRPREVVAVVGESGSGKTTIGTAVVDLLPPNAVVTSGSITFDGQDLLGLSQKALRSIRGRRIGVVPQDPMASLNPTKRIGAQVGETLLLHGLETRSTVRAKVLDLLREAGLDDAERVVDAFPHELSGGMRQRVLIAIAFAAGPELIIADEPTSALDVTVAKRIMDHLQVLVRERGTALLLITHDLALAVHRADRVVVMRGGQVVETGAAADVLRRPQHAYTQELVRNAPHLQVADRPAAPEGADATAGAYAASNSDALLRVHGLSKTFTHRKRGEFRAVDDVSFAIPEGGTFALVGESGSGKSTTARMVLRLEQPTSGRIEFEDQDVTDLRGEPLRAMRRRMQVVYQSPFDSLDPRMRISEIVEEPLRAFRTGEGPARAARVRELLDAVGLGGSFASRKPRELSGGQRQRVAIARALALSPRLVVCDEPVSALDVLIQAQVLRLMKELQAEFGVAYLFISHDLGTVHHFAEHVGVMNKGRLVETGTTADVFANPRDPYTRTLLDSATNL